MKIKDLPTLIRVWATNNNIWVVGGAADINATVETVEDIDILVPFHNWHSLAPYIPKDAQPNSFGGWKFTTEGIEVDIWPGDIGFLLTSPLTKYVWHPATNFRYIKCGEVTPVTGK